VLIGCAVGAMMYKGMFPVWLGALIVGRDAFLVTASVAKRFQQVGWVWPGADAFFKSQPDAAGPGGAAVPTAHRVEPLMVSKVNTVLQLLLVAACLSRPLLGWPEAGVVDALTAATAVTTVASCGAYAVKMARGV
jgi:cardiolipin synthase (CMP-forming)